MNIISIVSYLYHLHVFASPNKFTNPNSSGYQGVRISEGLLYLFCATDRSNIVVRMACDLRSNNLRYTEYNVLILFLNTQSKDMIM